MTTIILNHSSKVEKSFSDMKLCELAWSIKEDWRKQKGGIHVYAKEWLDAMMTLNSMNDKFMAESARTVVAYFLSNANTWKGDVAREIKKELKKRIK